MHIHTHTHLKVRLLIARHLIRARFPAAFPHEIDRFSNEEYLCCEFGGDKGGHHRGTQAVFVLIVCIRVSFVCMCLCIHMFVCCEFGGNKGGHHGCTYAVFVLIVWVCVSMVCVRLYYHMDARTQARAHKYIYTRALPRCLYYHMHTRTHAHTHTHTHTRAT